MTPTANPMTAEELLDMPDDSYRYELVRGEVRRMLHPWLYHGVNGSRIVETMLPHVRRNGLGEVPLPSPGFVLIRNPDHVREPDVSFIRQRADR